MRLYDDFTLLVDGKEAFPETLRCIAEAKKSVYINMFIWRDDEIGNAIGQAVFDAAQCGVQVEISADRYGVVLEKSEECKRSFFHKRQSLTEKIKTAALEILYPMEGAPRRAKDEETALYRQKRGREKRRQATLRRSKGQEEKKHARFWPEKNL